ncbi:hypothetical protein Pan216_38660 [Planctomycetes bacterium Pan216]|uniref:Lipocalin-like domain-containing protein n=1 Tax=Kolteria novifilia TaxID=2527975 RepID=A0A518B7R1_9BACT|nr:hypothetical protein Pan216_38660 [Planctomycetes bacterium Pan216]
MTQLQPAQTHYSHWLRHRALATLRGTWRLSSSLVDGEPVDDDQIGGNLLMVSGTRMIRTLGDEYLQADFSLNAMQLPALIDFTATRENTVVGQFHGVAEITRDRLALCYVPVGIAVRPLELASPRGSNHVLERWIRV